MNAYAGVKVNLRRACFDLADIQRVHIIGCSRSGTTMLHLAMSYFRNVFLSPTETPAEAPFLRERIATVWRARKMKGSISYVTKRNYGWFKPENVERLVDITRRESVGVIHILRDPRDVMTSTHASGRRAGGAAGAQGDSAYVDYEHWHRSILAADEIFGRLGSYPRKLEIRYEDVVTNPDRVASQLKATFDLEPRQKDSSFGHLKENLEAAGAEVHPSLVQAVHSLRNMDPSSVGRWRSQDGKTVLSLVEGPDEAKRLRAFLDRFGYE